MNGKRRQHGFALMLVLVLVAVAMVLGLGYLSTASSKMISSRNLVGAAHAEYLAESGLQHAMYLFKASASTVNGGATLGPFYIDSSSDRYSFYAQSTTTGKYTIYSDGYSGTYHVQKNASIALVAGGRASIAQAVLSGTGSVTIPSSVTITGNVVVDGGSLTNNGRINGNASATGTITDSQLKISGTKTPNMIAIAKPVITAAQYSDTYAIIGSQYFTYKPNNKYTIDSSDHWTNGGLITSTNPGGIIYINGNVTIHDNVTFKGTIVASGNVTLHGKNISMTAVDGFPAIVSGGSIMLDRNATATVNGMVVAPSGLSNVDNSTNNAPVVTFNGGYWSSGNAFDSSLKGTVGIVFSSTKTSIYDQNIQGGASSVEILSWN